MRCAESAIFDKVVTSFEQLGLLVYLLLNHRETSLLLQIELVVEEWPNSFENLLDVLSVGFELHLENSVIHTTNLLKWILWGYLDRLLDKLLACHF